MKLHVLVVAALLAAGAAQADTLSKIKDTGLVSIGVRESAGALSFAQGGGRYGGFHVELCEWVVAGVNARRGLPRPVIRYQSATAREAAALLRSGEIDLDCGDAVNTAARQREAGFALTTFVPEARAREPIAIMLRKGDAAFKREVDDILRGMMRSGDLADLYNQWFTQARAGSGVNIGVAPNQATLEAWAEPSDRPAEAHAAP